MESGLVGRAVVVTGAGRGIGKEVAREVARLGGLVVVNDIDEAAAAATAQEIGGDGKAVAHAADVADAAAAEALVQRCVAEFGRIDGLVNNAALMAVGDLVEHDAALLRRVLEVNVVGVANCAAAAVRPMLRQGSGSIVNVTSGAHLGLPHMGAYAASKGAVASLTYAWASETAGTGVRVNALSPFGRGFMTRMTDDYLIERGHADAPFEAPDPATNAPIVAYLLSDRGAAVHGQIVRVDGTKLSLMTHPAIMTPVLQRPVWTFEDVDRAFTEVLAARQAPVGIAWGEPAVTQAPEPREF